MGWMSLENTLLLLSAIFCFAKHYMPIVLWSDNVKGDLFYFSLEAKWGSYQIRKIAVCKETAS